MVLVTQQLIGWQVSFCNLSAKMSVGQMVFDQKTRNRNFDFQTFETSSNYFLLPSFNLDDANTFLEQRRAGQSRAEQGRAGQSRAEQGRAGQS